MIVNAYKSKIETNPEITIREVRGILSKELGVGETTISNTIKEYRELKTVTSPIKEKNFKNVTTKTDEFDKDAIRMKIYQLLINRELPTLNKILSVVNADKSLPSFSRATLHRLLKSMDLEYVKRGRKSGLLDSNNLILWRRRYLRNIRKYREEGRPIYYLDETWVNAGDVTNIVLADKTAQSSQVMFSQGHTRGAINPTGNRKNLLVIYIGSEDGFVPGGLLCIKTKNNTNDYHDEINGNTFREWLESLLPRLKDNAVIVMDNAPHHSDKMEKFPTENWRKTDIINWLVSKGEVIDNTMIIPELLQVVERLKPLYNKYIIDELVLQHNKVVLRLPPYHGELNPIEMAWSVVKNYVKSNNKTFELNDVQKLFIEGTKIVNENMWKNFITQTKKKEDKFWNMDMIIDELLAEQPPVVMIFDNSDDDNPLSDSD